MTLTYPLISLRAANTFPRVAFAFMQSSQKYAHDTTMTAKSHCSLGDDEEATSRAFDRINAKG